MPTDRTKVMGVTADVERVVWRATFLARGVDFVFAATAGRACQLMHSTQDWDAIHLGCALRCPGDPNNKVLQGKQWERIIEEAKTQRLRSLRARRQRFHPLFVITTVYHELARFQSRLLWSADLRQVYAPRDWRDQAPRELVARAEKIWGRRRPRTAHEHVARLNEQRRVRCAHDN